MGTTMNPQISSWHQRIKNEKFNAITRLVKLELINLTIYLIATAVLINVFHFNLTKVGLFIGCAVLITIVPITNMWWFRRTMAVNKYCNLYLTELKAVMKSSEIIAYMLEEKLDNISAGSLVISIAMDHLMHIEKLDELNDEIKEFLEEMDLDTMVEQMKQKAEFESEVCFELLKDYMRFIGLEQ